MSAELRRLILRGTRSTMSWFLAEAVGNPRTGRCAGALVGRARSSGAGALWGAGVGEQCTLCQHHVLVRDLLRR